ncbi:MAG: imelysin family protein [Sandaracinaceae bacterium]
MAEAEYEDSLGGVQALSAAIAAFRADPTDATLEAARQAWLDSRVSYLQTEPWRYYGGPIEQGDPEREGALNGWPIDESVIDYVVDPASGEIVMGGVVNSTDPIDGPLLRSLNATASETALTTGYHPIEFLLWGQDDPSESGPGNRPLTDFTTDPQAERRLTYLTVAAQLMEEDLAGVLAEWRDEPTTFRTAFREGDPQDRLADVFLGLASMSGPELAGERIGVALDTRDQEDEHSCFSDNTHHEIYLDALGIRNVYLGEYVRTDGTRVEGPSPSDLVRARDPDLDARIREQLDMSVSLAMALPGPFDEMILSPAGRAQLDAVVTPLFLQSDLFVEAAALFEIDLTL